MNLSELKNVHFVGIGGIGMSGLAEVLATGGVHVTGCDLKRSPATDLLESRGVSVLIGHDAAHLDGVDLVVTTAAVRGPNAEVDAARERGTRIVRRAELLGGIVNAKRAIGVSGTHGKTTTSAMMAMILEDAGLDPTVLVGGMVRNLGTNAKAGQGAFLVVEADEYDRTFHHLHPEVAIVTNIEADHLEYYGSLEAIDEAFRVYLEGVRPGGAIVGCIDDAHVASLFEGGFMPPAGTTVVRYGLSPGADVRATNIEYSGRGSSFEIPGLGWFKLFVPGEHNVRNALAAIATARYLGVDAETIAVALSRFLGVDRRFQVLGSCNGAVVVDDYAHHPTEIRATLDAARRGYPDRRLVALFQPHLYSRTQELAREFGEALRIADVSFVVPIYAAREEPIPGVSSLLISDAVAGVEFLDGSNAVVASVLRGRLAPDDIFIAMGAGDVHEIASELVSGEAA